MKQTMTEDEYNELFYRVVDKARKWCAAKDSRKLNPTQITPFLFTTINRVVDITEPTFYIKLPMLAYNPTNVRALTSAEKNLDRLLAAQDTK